MQVVEILSRIAICERASIDECYLDLTEEAHKRLAACGGQPPLPVNPDRVHICGQVSMLMHTVSRDKLALADGTTVLACFEKLHAQPQARPYLTQLVRITCQCLASHKQLYMQVPTNRELKP